MPPTEEQSRVFVSPGQKSSNKVSLFVVKIVLFGVVNFVDVDKLISYVDMLGDSSVLEISSEVFKFSVVIIRVVEVVVGTFLDIKIKYYKYTFKKVII